MGLRYGYRRVIIGGPEIIASYLRKRMKNIQTSVEVGCLKLGIYNRGQNRGELGVHTVFTTFDRGWCVRLCAI